MSRHTSSETDIEHLDFRYSPDTLLIEDLTIDVHQGQNIAIVGPTGAGKTTLVNLLMRFYNVNQGRITVDGVDIRDIKRGSLRRIFGMVLQDTWLFNATIRDNIAYGRDGATEEEVVQYDDLLAKGGFYADLYNSQFAGAHPDEAVAV